MFQETTGSYVRTQESEQSVDNLQKELKMLKLNWLGKAFFGAAGTYAAARLAESAFSSEDAPITKEQVLLLLEVYRADDIHTFKSIYLSYRPRAAVEDVLHAWQLCADYDAQNR